MSNRQRFALAGFLLAWFAVAAVTFRSTTPSEPVPLPSFSPSVDVLRLLWAVAPVLLALAAFLLWRRWGWRGSGGALNLWVLVLLLHAGWPVVFLDAADAGLALTVAVLLSIAAFAAVTAFRSRSRLAAWVLVPYGLFVAYVTLITGVVWWALAA